MSGVQIQMRHGRPTQECSSVGKMRGIEDMQDYFQGYTSPPVPVALNESRVWTAGVDMVDHFERQLGGKGRRVNCQAVSTHLQMAPVVLALPCYTAK